MLFVLGGNGTHAGADAIHNEVIKPLKVYILGVLILCYVIFYDGHQGSNFRKEVLKQLKLKLLV